MAMSGVVLDDEVLSCYKDQMQIKKSECGGKQCMILKISDDHKKIILDKTFDEDALCFEDLKRALPADEGRYVLYDFHYQTKNGQQNKKVIFIPWNPDCGKIKLKMLYSASKDAVKKKMDAVALEVQANDLGDLDEADIADKLARN